MGEASTTAPLRTDCSPRKSSTHSENADKNSTLQARKKPNLRREMPQSFEVFWSRATSQKGLCGAFLLGVVVPSALPHHVNTLSLGLQY